MLKEPIYRWKTKKALKSAEKRETVGFEDAKHIGILFENDQNHRTAQPFISELTNAGKQVTVLVRSNEKEPPSPRHYTEKQFKWYGKIEAMDVKKFVSTPFDYLLMMSDSIHYLNRYILAVSKSRCRVGMYNKSNEPYFELMFQPKGKVPNEDFYDSVQGYLEKIKTA